MISFFRLFRKRKLPSISISDIDRNINHKKVVKHKKKVVKHKFKYPNVIENVKDCIINPGEYSWFKCKLCDKKVMSKNDNKMFYYIFNDYNISTVKLCKECISEIAFLMDCSQQDIDEARSRMIVRKLKGDDDVK